MPFPLPTDDPPPACPAGLYVVATPIGNLEDITLRALHTLAGVDLIAAEDTRHTARLLNHYKIRTPLISCHEHNEAQRTGELIQKIHDGAAVALVSDAGTPSVSDPGYRLIHEAVAKELTVVPVPGVSAAITALSASGLTTDAFVFLGFAPKKKGHRMRWLESLAAESRTLIFYESPRRVVAFLEELQSTMGDRPAVLARELTKRHEEFIRGTVSRIIETLAGRPVVKGECTLLVAGKAADAPVDAADLESVLKSAMARPGVHLASLTKELSGRYRLPRKMVYDLALKLRQAEGKGNRS